METPKKSSSKRTLIICGRVFLSVVFLFTCWSTPAMALDLDRLREDLKPLDLSIPYEPTPAVKDYFDFYGLNPAEAQHWFGTVVSKGETLAVHVFLPENPAGTIFLVHGFLDHTGTLSRLIHEAVARNYAVVSWDLPGHGLTSGERTETGDFALCAAQLEEILERVKDRLPQPVHLVAHSTGAAIAMEYLYHSEARHFERIVLLAPLVRHAHWGWGKFGYAITDPFLDRIGRKEKENSSDAAYLEFARNDPLRIESVSFEYIEDLYDWEKRVRDYPEWEDPVLIIQGDLDDVVDWKYNLEFLKKKMSNADIRIIPGARHHLANEIEEYRSRVFDLAFGWLSKQTLK